MDRLLPVILLVDDVDDVRVLALRELHDYGVCRFDMISGDFAFVLLQQGLKPRLLFTDIVMPGDRDGVALAQDAKLLVPDVRVLYATGFMGFTRAKSGGVLHGDVLRKPYSLSSLIDMVHRLLPGPV